MTWHHSHCRSSHPGSPHIHLPTLPEEQEKCFPLLFYFPNLVKCPSLAEHKLYQELWKQRSLGNTIPRVPDLMIQRRAHNEQEEMLVAWVTLSPAPCYNFFLSFSILWDDGVYIYFIQPHITVALFLQLGCRFSERKVTYLNPFFESPQCPTGILLYTLKVYNKYLQIDCSVETRILAFRPPIQSSIQHHSAFLH